MVYKVYRENIYQRRKSLLRSIKKRKNICNNYKNKAEARYFKCYGIDSNCYTVLNFEGRGKLCIPQSEKHSFGNNCPSCPPDSEFAKIRCSPPLNSPTFKCDWLLLPRDLWRESDKDDSGGTINEYCTIKYL